MTPAYEGSFTAWCSPIAGTVLWPFAFTDGYIDRAYVKVRYKDFNGVWWPVKINPATDFESEFVLRIEPPIPPCEIVDIYRDTPKDHPIVVYGNGGTLLSTESRNAAARQSIHVTLEMLDAALRTDLECKCQCVEGLL